MNSLRSLGFVATKLLEEPTENQAVFRRLAKENRLKDNIQRNPASSVSQCPSRSEDGKEEGAERSLRMTRHVQPTQISQWRERPREITGEAKGGAFAWRGQDQI